MEEQRRSLPTADKSGTSLIPGAFTTAPGWAINETGGPFRN